MVRVLSLVAAAGLLLGTVAPAHAGPSNTKDMGKAYSVAQAVYPGAQLLKARVELGGIFGFYFWVDDRIVEIEVSKEFEIVKKKDQKDPDQVKDIPADVLKMLQKKGRAKLPPGRLLEIAADNLKDTPLSEIKYDKVGDKLVLQVGDLTLDAETGKPVKNR